MLSVGSIVEQPDWIGVKLFNAPVFEPGTGFTFLDIARLNELDNFYAGVGASYSLQS
jgi:hypothetical protein